MSCGSKAFTRRLAYSVTCTARFHIIYSSGILSVLHLQQTPAIWYGQITLIKYTLLNITCDKTIHKPCDMIPPIMLSYTLQSCTYLYIFAVFPSNSGMATSGAVAGYVTAIYLQNNRIFHY